MPAKQEEWTPYALEGIRVAYLRRRRIMALLIALGLAGTWAWMFQATSESTFEIFVNGQRQSLGGIQIDEPELPDDGPVTVEIQAGRVTRADTAGQPADSGDIPRASAPVFTRDEPIPYRLYIFLYGPYVLLAAALFFLAKKRGRHDEVNYGIYKGAMPLEMISHSMADQVFTTRKARSSLFGKRRADHLPEEVVRIERVPQEEA